MFGPTARRGDRGDHPNLSVDAALKRRAAAEHRGDNSTAMLFENFWYVLAESRAPTDEPLRARALGQAFVLFRRWSDRAAVALRDRCFHRMASLSEGVVDGDCVRCPNHGWAYGADGACSHIPANGRDAVVPRRARIDTDPVVERYGWVWVCIGDAPEAERPPIPALDAFDGEDTRAVRGEFLWQSGSTRVVENTVDVAHTPFLQADLARGPVHGGVAGSTGGSAGSRRGAERACSRLHERDPTASDARNEW